MRTLVLGAAALIGVVATAALPQTRATGTTRTHAECASLFLKLDRDGDGRISRAEASADPFIASVFATRTPGQPDDLTAEEFMAVCQKPPDAHRRAQ